MRKTPENLTECSQKDLLKRIEEVMTRIWGKLPDGIMEWDFERYKVWISEPFLVLEYEEYNDSEQI